MKKLHSKSNSNVILSAVIGVLMSVPIVSLQAEEQAQATGEADMIDLFQGCHPKKKPDCQTRIVCTGKSSIHGNNPRAVLIAEKIAASNANVELTKYFGNKTKVVEDIKQLDKVYSKDSGAGTQNQTESGQLISTVQGTSAEQFLQGVSVIGGKVDVQGGEVSVVIGQSCDSVATAQGMVGKMQQGQNQQSGNNGTTANGSTADGTVPTGGPQVHFGTPQTKTQRPNDDF